MRKPLKTRVVKFKRRDGRTIHLKVRHGFFPRLQGNYFRIEWRSRRRRGLHASLGTDALEAGKKVRIRTFLVSIPAREMGLGTKMVQTLVAEARKRKVRTLTIDLALEVPDLINLLIKNGFVKIGGPFAYRKADGSTMPAQKLELKLG